MNRHKIKRMVTDPKTGERTAIVTASPNGVVKWALTAEEEADKDRARSKGQRKAEGLNKFRRAIGG